MLLTNNLLHILLGQFLKSNIFKYCILGLLPQPQEATLCRFLDALSMLLREEQSVPNLDSLDLELNGAMALMERDFSCVIQVPFLIKDQWYNLFIYLHCDKTRQTFKNRREM